MGEDIQGNGDDADIWDRLLIQQTTIYRQTTAQNHELKSRVEDLEREVGVWKAALKAADEREHLLTKNVVSLEQKIGSLKDDNPLVACLIDGDGNVFKDDLLAQGQVGGRQAALQLTMGLTDYVASLDAGLAGRAQIWLTMYFHKSGLLDVLVGQQICTAEQFEAFILGFTQANPLFSVVDVGIGKEAADVKIKEALRVFARFPQIPKVFFGGCHDNGYLPTLTHLENEGFLHKIVLLPGYNMLASDLKKLELPSLEVEVFMTKKIVARKAPVQPHDFERFKGTSPRAESTRSLSPTKHNSPNKGKAVDPSMSVGRLRPAPCNYYYLSECKTGVKKCKYSHEYILTPQQLQEVRINAAKTPCPIANRNQMCRSSPCIFGHVCPRGPKCIFFKQGKCKFTGTDMHKALTSASSPCASPNPAPIPNSPRTNNIPSLWQAGPGVAPSPFMPFPGSIGFFPSFSTSDFGVSPGPGPSSR